MHVHDYIKQFMDKKICYNCVGETFLKDQILESGEIAICNYCNKNSKSYSIDELASLLSNFLKPAASAIRTKTGKKDTKKSSSKKG